MNLDAKTIAALSLGDRRDAIHFDDTLKGFGFRLRGGSGGKLLRSWIVQYKRAGSTRRMLLGSGEVLSAEQARNAAKKILAQVALGQDPQATKSERRDKDRISFRATVDEYLAIKKERVRARTFYEIERYLTGAYFKPLHGMPLDQITRRDIASRLVSISRETGSVTAARARSTLCTFFVWAMQMGLIENNPTIGTIKPKDSEERTRVLSGIELAAVWSACQEDDGGRIVRLLVLLGCRRQEVGGMCWTELSEQGTWTLPAARSKNHCALTLPLMPMALDIINAVPRLVSRNQLFGTRGKGFNNWFKLKRALAERSGVTDWCLHDLRRTFATGLGDLKVQPHIIEQILNHQSGHKAGVAGTYNRSIYANEVRAALALWEDHVRTLVVEGSERQVLPFAARGAI